MDVVVTDLTRMRDEHICIAGIDLRSGNRVRPKLAGISVPQNVAHQFGGTVRLGSVLRFESPWLVPAVPEVEDAIVAVEAMVERSRMGAEEFSTLVQSSAGRVGDQIQNLQRTGRSMVVAAGTGSGSLAIATCRPSFRLFAEARRERPRIRALLDANLDVSATDLRLYEGDAPRRAAVEDLARRARNTAGVVLGVGLTRPFSPDGESLPVHWLQLNTVHLLDDPYWEPAR